MHYGIFFAAPRWQPEDLPGEVRQRIESVGTIGTLRHSWVACGP
jgi:hypothetical protein